MPTALPSKLQDADRWKKGGAPLVSLVQEHLDRGGDVNAVTRKGLTLLHLACYYAQDRVLRVLQQHGGGNAQARTTEVYDWQREDYLRAGATPLDAARVALLDPARAPLARECISLLLYEGEWRELKRHGRGVQIFDEDGLRYEGEWAADLRHGRGVTRSGDDDGGGGGGGDDEAAGTLLDGQWEDGLFTGRGRRVYKDGSWYDGDWVRGERTGEGALDTGNGLTYRGGVLAGKYHGPDGELRDADGNRYRGAWHEGRRHGRGRQEYTDGSVYEGDWEEDLYHGDGALVAGKTGDRYEGGFRRGQRHGPGHMTYRYNSGYEGVWVDGKRHGCGVFRWPNGQRTFREYCMGKLIIGGIRVDEELDDDEGDEAGDEEDQDKAGAQ